MKGWRLYVFCVYGKVFVIMVVNFEFFFYLDFFYVLFIVVIGLDVF